MKSFEEMLAIVCGFLNCFAEKFPHKKVGSLILQKMMFLFEQEKKWNLGFSLNNRGPFSELVESILIRAQSAGNIGMYPYQRGHYIRLLKCPQEVSDEDKKLIEQLVEKYGRLCSDELVILTTVLFLKDRFEVESKSQLIDLISESRPQMERAEIKKIINLIE